MSSPNPNGSIAIVFTYAGTTFATYDDFVAAFQVTLPGGAGVELGPDQVYGQASGGARGTLQLGTSVPLASTTSPIGGLLPTHATGNANLAKAFANWAATQSSSPGATSPANLYLDWYTGGRIYLSSGDLGLAGSGEPVPASPGDPAYALTYDLFEPFVGAQIGSTTIPGNGADITNIDWFSFPISIKVWYYDFGDPTSTTLTTTIANTRTIEQGGSGSSIAAVLQVGGATTLPTNAYPNQGLPAPNTSGTPVPRRLAGPTAAATAGYYTDPATDPFPYHYFDDYLAYLAKQQTGASTVTLTGNFAGVGEQNTLNTQAQNFSLAVDFSNITTATMNYPSGARTQITTQSSIKLTGYTTSPAGAAASSPLGSPAGAPLLGSAESPFTIELPWAMGTSTDSLQVSNTLDALAQGWLVQQTPQTAPSGTYPPVAASVRDASGDVLVSQSQAPTNVQLVYSINQDPASGTPDELWAVASPSVSFSNPSGLTMLPSVVVTQAGDATTAIVQLGTDAQGKLASVKVFDFGAPSNTTIGSTWTFPPNAQGLGNSQSFVITLTAAPQLRSAYLLASGTYASTPASLQLSPSTAASATLGVAAAALTSVWVPDPSWTTLDQPAGIYGANTGYVIAGLTGAAASLNGNVTSLQNDVFGWIVADLLAALNVGYVGSPVIDPDTGKSIGDSPSDWFEQSNRLYAAGLWGAKAWAGQGVDDFWNTWAYDLATVPGGSDAYGFAFTDRFAQGILVGFNPPPPNASAPSPVLVEVIVGDSPLLSAS